MPVDLAIDEKPGRVAQLVVKFQSAAVARAGDLEIVVGILVQIRWIRILVFETLRGNIQREQALPVAIVERNPQPVLENFRVG